MNRVLLIALIASAMVAGRLPALKADSGMTARELIAVDPGRSGGIYYAYPVTADSMPALPDGYRVAALSHYGRHGSRWLIKTWEYDEAVETLEGAGELTPLGRETLESLRRVRSTAVGREGSLSRLGERQHRDIAERMYRRFPVLFEGDSMTVRAYCSTEPRCIISMAACSERLKELNPALTVLRQATPGDMSFINYKSHESKVLNNENSSWWDDLERWRDSVLDPARLVASLVANPAKVADPRRLMWVLHDVAIDQQDVEPAEPQLMELFTADELYNLWTALNYKMYYLHGNNPAAGAGAGPRCAVNLLGNFIADVDSMAAGRGNVNLRFGHDTALLRLMALMGIEGADAVMASPREYADGWRDFELTPMAANLQVVVLTAGEGEPLVLLRHNEKPVRLTGLEPAVGDYYRWAYVKQLWIRAIDGAAQ